MNLKNLSCGLIAFAWFAISTEALALRLPRGRNTVYESHCNAYLTAQDYSSRISLREGPGTDYKKLGYGLVGDFVHIMTTTPPEIDQVQDIDGNFWKIVKFPRSGAKGWIRADFLDIYCRSIND
ncbi:MAG: SH3 domain-containing protein [Symploca sp. SIO2E6]|nr:SH3 domain-containing protein [Symploca sp. SIO2E6]